MSVCTALSEIRSLPQSFLYKGLDGLFINILQAMHRYRLQLPGNADFFK